MSDGARHSLARLAGAIDRFSEGVGRVVAWIVLAMVGLVVYDVAMRYLFQAGSVALQELEWHLFAALFLLGAGYTLKHDGHVRIDLVYQGRWMNDRRRAWVDLLGTLLFLMPFCVLVIWASWPFVHQAFVHGEGSPDPGGLPHRWVLKAVIPLGFALLMVQGVAMAAKAYLTLRDRT